MDYFTSFYCFDILSIHHLKQHLNMMHLTTISAKFVANILSKINQHKLPGPNDSHSHLLRLHTPVISRHLDRLFELSIITGNIKDEWRSAVVASLLMKGARTDIANYR